MRYATHGHETGRSLAHKRKNKTIQCPVEYALDVFSGKRKNHILRLLDRGPMRYGEIRDEFEGVSDTSLSQALKELVDDEMIKREHYAEIPPRVEYRLTQKGRDFMPVMHTICQWAGKYSYEACRDCEFRL